MAAPKTLLGLHGFSCIAKQWADSPIRKAAQQLERGPFVRLAGQLADSPIMRLARQLEDSSPAVRLARQLEDSPSVRITRHFERLMPESPMLGKAKLTESFDRITKSAGLTTIRTIMEEHSKRMRQVADSISQATAAAAPTSFIRQMKRVSALRRPVEAPGLLRISQLVTEAAAAAARLALNIRLVLPTETWWEALRRARANAPKRWRDVYAAKDGLEVGNARKLEELTVGPLNLTRSDIGYVYEAILQDDWENSRDPIAYLKVAARRRRVRDEAKGTWGKYQNEEEQQRLAFLSNPDLQAQTLLVEDPAKLLDIVRVAEQLDLKPDGAEYARAWLVGTTEGELLAQGWSRQRLDRGKKQLQRALARLRGRYLQ